MSVNIFPSFSFALFLPKEKKEDKGITKKKDLQSYDLSILNLFLFICLLLLIQEPLQYCSSWKGDATGCILCILL